MMEKRVLLAVSLSFLVLVVYQSYFAPPLPTPGDMPATQSAPAPGEVPSPEPAGSPEAEDGASPALEPAPPPAAALRAAGARQDVVVETPNVEAVFDNRGAVLKSWRLKRFQDAEGQPLELIPQDVPPGAARPFQLELGDEALTARAAAALFEPSSDRLTLQEPGTLVFRYEDAAGLRIVKTFAFDPSVRPYMVALTVEAEHNGQALNPTVHWGPAIAGAGAEVSQYFQQPEAIYGRGGDVERVDQGDLAGLGTLEGPFSFAGVDDQYFLAAVVPGNQPVKVAYQAVPMPGAQGSGSTLVAYRMEFGSAPSGVPFFVGPKDFDVLASIDRELVRAINFGIFGFLVVPLLRSLKWINEFVGNYGWSIIILTILINAVMFPLRHKSVVSMRKMQELQPEVKSIQERYGKLKATDPARQKMNTELMNLYRERGVNPASGCLPMLLTMPVLFAFYSLLSVAIEIRGAPFVLWIKDLSAHDPLYITPILMGITMVVQQKMTPSTADPTQQKIMMMMPIMFTFMFLWAPSGLVLYWLVSNLWAIGQQHVTNRIIGPPVVRTVRPPAERRTKKPRGARPETSGEGA